VHAKARRRNHHIISFIRQIEVLTNFSLAKLQVRRRLENILIKLAKIFPGRKSPNLIFIASIVAGETLPNRFALLSHVRKQYENYRIRQSSIVQRKVIEFAKFNKYFLECSREHLLIDIGLN